MNIFVLNSGSSSIKYQLFNMPGEQPVCSGLIERIGLDNAIITHKVFKGEEEVIKLNMEIADHEAGLMEIKKLLTDPTFGVINDPAEIVAVGHRVVHGGESFAATVIISNEVKAEIKKLFSLAPLHNPANYTGIEHSEKIFTSAKQVAVFDTAFHQTMPDKAFRYAIPQNFYTEMRIRSYGFHGTSHKYVAAKAMEHLGKADAKIITIHLGNGCSMAAVNAGKSIDTSMGFGPLGGLVMGTRSGDIDPAVIFHLINQMGFDSEQVNNLLNKRSGMFGLTGFSDMRDIIKAMEQGDDHARLAYAIYAYRVKKYIGSYVAVMNGVDALVFTAGVGENDPGIRALICAELNYLGIEISETNNLQKSRELREINPANAKVKVLVIPTNEELEIARQCYELLHVG
ncbi:acetate kinase [Segetibacter sp. 3557_3]|uniref:acetate/propionate family kinase n=1 Tax=Segetibacter sp. 3557_3 TaxID=2547429 RepID=UPI00105911CB|nr:acetate kinase [Segetibacter sp. 3557_3]TDH27946.1 acetate kinase [Segetibacter sp. 3557_3]